MKRLKSLPGYVSNRTPRNGYDWDKILGGAGQITECLKGEDYTCSCASFQLQLRAQANKRNLNISVYTIQDPDNPKKRGTIVHNKGKRKDK